MSGPRAPGPNSPQQRGLQLSEQRAIFLAGDAVALTGSVAVALWTWSITAGSTFDWSFTQERIAWFVAVPVWLLALSPS